MNLTKIVTLAMAMALTALTANAAKTAAKTEKRKPSSVAAPPQFVLLAFDGSYNNEFWQESQDFAASVNTVDSKGNPTKVKFTYFVNPPYYLDAARKAAYKTPGLGVPRSCIGWASVRADIGPRIDLTNKAFKAGHEIGSHANSHCDASGVDRSNPLYGHRWGLNEWKSEFKQFNDIFFNLLSVNGLPGTAASPNGIAFDKSEIVGFRAPLLATTPEMWPALRDFGFKYDTSKSSEPTYWPQKHATGIWNFPLGEIKIAGTNRKTFSMDYNWLCRQSACVTKAGLTETERQQFKNQMLDSYKYYFKINYFGGRGPIHIGHHFSKWNKGAYWDAMKEFTQFVCSKPDVRCVTYKEYMQWLDSQSPETLAAYRAGDFNRLRDDGSIRTIAIPLVMPEVRMEETQDGLIATADLATRDAMGAKGYKLQLSVNWQPVAGGTRLPKAELAQLADANGNALVRASVVNQSGVEVNAQTFRYENAGRPNENIVGPLEDLALQGEGIEAHTQPE